VGVTGVVRGGVAVKQAAAFGWGVGGTGSGHS